MRTTKGTPMLTRTVMLGILHRYRQNRPGLERNNRNSGAEEIGRLTSITRVNDNEV